MDVGEEEEADAFDFDDDVLVFFDALYVACVALEGAADDADGLVGGEVVLLKISHRVVSWAVSRRSRSMELWGMVWMRLSLG